jgi:hypothetical protein
MNRELAAAYYKLLKAIPWEDELVVRGIREGLNKFLSNAYLSMSSKCKHECAHFYSLSAISAMKNGDKRDLVFEHMVPKGEYIQRPCENAAQEGKLTIDYIEEILDKYWKIAVITAAEDRMLSSRKMPKDWDYTDYKARYTLANIALLPVNEANF